MAVDAARRAGSTLLWQKIFTFTAGPQPIAVGRPGFSVMTCFGTGASPSFDPRASPAPDVLERGPQLWNRGAGCVLFLPLNVDSK